MVEQIKVTSRMFFKVAAAVAAIFIAGLAIGFILDSLRTDFLNEELIAANIETESFSVSQAYIQDHPEYCALTAGYIAQLSETVEQLGKDLAAFGSKMVFINSTFLDRRYFIYEIRLWMMIEEYKERCDRDIDTILFFYSDRYDASYAQGLVLTAIKEKFGDDVMIFSFKHGFDEPALKLVESNYNVTSSPSLVVNGKLYPGLMEKAELEDILG